MGNNTFLISNELANFLQLPNNVLVTYWTVHDAMWNYIETHRLQSHNNHPLNIDADANLRALLRLTDANELNIYNFMKYVSIHFREL